MRKFAWLTTGLMLVLLGISVFLSVNVAPVSAIGEVTPTPVPVEPEPEDDVDVEDLIEDAIEDLQNGEFRSALAKMDSAIEADPDNALAFFIRGFSNFQLGFTDDSLDDFSSAIDIEPWQTDYYLFRGDVYRADGSLTDALLDYDIAIDINPFSLDAFLRRSIANYELGDSTAGDVDDLIARALQDLSAGDTTSALAFLDEAINTGDTLRSIGDAYYIRAIANDSLGDDDAVLDDYNSALEINSDLHIVHLARGIYYRENDDIVAAGEDFFQRMTLHRGETVEQDVTIGDELEVEMTYRRVVELSFDGEEGQVITISASDQADTIVDPLITLLGPDGTPIAGDDDFGTDLNSLIEDFELPEDGTYTLLVSHAEGGAQIGFNGIIDVEIEEE
ncbi:MAG: tetratricopeptide repeat protein [Chloroflexota bacterium]